MFLEKYLYRKIEDCKGENSYTYRLKIDNSFNFSVGDEISFDACSTNTDSTDEDTSKLTLVDFDVITAKVEKVQYSISDLESTGKIDSNKCDIYLDTVTLDGYGREVIASHQREYYGNWTTSGHSLKDIINS